MAHALPFTSNLNLHGRVANAQIIFYTWGMFTLIQYHKGRERTGVYFLGWIGFGFFSDDMPLRLKMFMRMWL